MADAFVWFADFDGVVCTARANNVTGRYDDPIAFGLLRQILDRTDGTLVVSSARRGAANLGQPNNCLDMIDRYGLTGRLHADWRTPSLASRSADIADWLARNGNPRYGILDDEVHDFTPAQMQRLIHTDMDFGLGNRDLGRALRLAATPMGADPVHADDLDGPRQSPRVTIAMQARAALAALDQGDDDAARRLLDIIAGHPLAQ